MPNDPRPRLIGGEVDGAVAPIGLGTIPRAVDVPLCVDMVRELRRPEQTKMPDPTPVWAVGTRFKNVGFARYELNDARNAYLHVETRLRDDRAGIVDGDE